jgi:anti-sigma regulatory factor (Ser/Thr protein kinase)
VPAVAPERATASEVPPAISTAGRAAAVIGPGPRSEKVDLEVALPCTETAPLLARWVLRTWFANRIEAGRLMDAELMVDELTTNAFLYGRGQITLRAYLDGDGLSVEVDDEGPAFERDPQGKDGEQTEV